MCVCGIHCMLHDNSESVLSICTRCKLFFYFKGKLGSLSVTVGLQEMPTMLPQLDGVTIHVHVYIAVCCICYCACHFAAMKHDTNGTNCS